MLKLPFNGQPIVTNKYRADPYNPHFGTDYAMPRRTALIAVTHGTVIAAKEWLPKDKPQEQRQWLANTNSDPYKKIVFGKLIPRALTTNDYGNYVKIDHGQGITTLYAHLDEVAVYVGQVVKEGQLIGYSDSSGNSTGDHLHFEIRVNERVIDPDKFDYSFTGEAGVEVEVHENMQVVQVVADSLYVRAGPSRTYRLAGSRILNKGAIVDTVGWVEGEEIGYKDPITREYLNNKIWYKSLLGNYFWAGGTNKPIQPEERETKQMTQEELDTRKASLDARKKELEDAMEVNKADFEKYEADVAAFQATPAASPVVEAPVETVAEPVVETVDPLKEEAKTLIEQLKAKFGL